MTSDAAEQASSEQVFLLLSLQFLLEFGTQLSMESELMDDKSSEVANFTRILLPTGLGLFA